MSQKRLKKQQAEEMLTLALTKAKDESDIDFLNDLSYLKFGEISNKQLIKLQLIYERLINGPALHYDFTNKKLEEQNFKIETLDEFLQRGGKIKKLPPVYKRFKK